MRFVSDADGGTEFGGANSLGISPFNASEISTTSPSADIQAHANLILPFCFTDNGYNGLSAHDVDVDTSTFHPPDPSPLMKRIRILQQPNLKTRPLCRSNMILSISLEISCSSQPIISTSSAQFSCLSPVKSVNKGVKTIFRSAALMPRKRTIC